MRRIKTIFCSLLMLISIMAVPCTTYAYTITASARLYDILGQRRYFFQAAVPADRLDEFWQISDSLMVQTN